MTELIQTPELCLMLHAAASRLRAEGERLSALDCIAGDGDHGTTMVRIAVQLEAMTPAGTLPGTLLRNLGWKVLGVDGGASSSLFGIFFTGMGNGCGDHAELNGLAFANACRTALAAVYEQTKARTGDKTMIDALEPAIGSLTAAVKSGMSFIEALQAAAKAALAGAEATRSLTAKFGRAKHLGERTLGHPDPGAVSVSLLFDGFHRGLAEVKGGTRNA